MASRSQFSFKELGKNSLTFSTFRTCGRPRRSLRFQRYGRHGATRHYSRKEVTTIPVLSHLIVLLLDGVRGSLLVHVHILPFCSAVTKISNDMPAVINPKRHHGQISTEPTCPYSILLEAAQIMILYDRIACLFYHMPLGYPHLNDACDWAVLMLCI